MCYSESASKTTSTNIYFIKKYFSSKFDLWGTSAVFYPEVPHRWNFDEKYFSIKYMLVDVVFEADSE